MINVLKEIKADISLYIRCGCPERVVRKILASVCMVSIFWLNGILETQVLNFECCGCEIGDNLEAEGSGRRIYPGPVNDTNLWRMRVGHAAAAQFDLHKTCLVDLYIDQISITLLACLSIRSSLLLCNI